MKKTQEPNVCHSALSLEQYAQIYAYIQQTKDKELQLHNFAKKSQIGSLITQKNLSEVLNIHGISGYKLNKQALMEKLEKLDTFDPLRSTMYEIYMGIDLPTEETDEDLAALGWLECPSKSVESVEIPADSQELALVVSEEDPICSPGYLMSAQSDTPSTVSTPPRPPSPTTTAEGNNKENLQRMREALQCKGIDPLPVLLQSLASTSMDLLKSVSQLRQGLPWGNSSLQNALDNEDFGKENGSCGSVKNSIAS